jgi:hypothetical protein
MLLLKCLGDEVRKPHTSKCCAVMGTETKLPCIELGSFFNASLENYQINFLEYEYFVRWREEYNRKEILMEFWVLTVFSVTL